ncbi:uncharacterized protein (DUF2147 family) [Rhodopseudomonas thermotolerans]|uniref:Uncharacterized protein (DUF2147 family) n=2 Tax=Rhodopseudomonas TaxID=1073 RepID=A0A336JTX8_9BRAD|nr:MULTISPECIES: DUF2147 domain-containing protein [Rhodopseudomonas]RED31816.1 uncharacterized protein (DUF2147 family) [Rhodopseudomonas pentothenatexigens]REF93117.1 uncharacterized protein (DUF2147 family) [Rhodopseudomonas thermotolerans]SSW91796.1 uncharacterized protein SAMN05892882_11456 [Rhodopseudomonas pentothenatexigens]
MTTTLTMRRAGWLTGLGLLAAIAATAGARADDVAGTWLRDTGASKVKFAPCGGAVCGTLVWIKPGVETPAKVGQKVFFDMKPTGPNAWAGSAFNPEDGKTYTGKMNLSGGTLTTQGCAMGGLICKSSTWTRAN